MPMHRKKLAQSATCVLLVASPMLGCDPKDGASVLPPRANDPALAARTPMDPSTLQQGRTIFRFATFGDQTFWTDTLRMHEVIRTAVSPITALSVGLKVDADALPADVKAAIRNKAIDLSSP